MSHKPTAGAWLNSPSLENLVEDEDDHPKRKYIGLDRIKEYFGVEEDEDVNIVNNYRESRIPGDVLGHYDPESKTIVLYPGAIQKHGGSLYKTFIHELLHHLQARRLLTSDQDRDISEFEAYGTNIDP